jgi:cyclophilin family peptidyl-prolyl cis-trans isomerase
MSISRLKLLGYLTITTTILSVAMWMSPERGKFLPFKGINQAVTQNRPNTQQQQRIALVIGNANYAVGKLKTPLNDATDMANALKELGFEVILLKDSSKRQMDDALDQFTTRINQGYVGLFYYAGHGMEVEGENYLIPVNAQIKAEKDVEYESMPLGKILGRMEDAGNRINIVILDACRDNPFRKFWRSSSRGLTAPVQAASGTLIAFATAPGKVASDGTGRNGLFTSYLLKYIKTPNMEVDLMMRKVRSDVAQNTNNYQVPWTSSSLIGEFAFNQKTETTPPPVTSSVNMDNYKPRLDGTAVVEMIIKGKPVKIEIDGNAAPITAGNFVDLVGRGFYNGLTFHRVVTEPQPFVAQGGDPQGRGTGGFVDPETKQPRYVPLEILLKDEKEPIYGKSIGQQATSRTPIVALPHKRGAIAMARSTQLNSASSQFYFALSDITFLDGDYAVFGYVTEGMEVIDTIKQGDKIDSAKVVSGAENLKK